MKTVAKEMEAIVLIGRIDPAAEKALLKYLVRSTKADPLLLISVQDIEDKAPAFLVYLFGPNKGKGQWKSATTLEAAVAQARGSIPEDLVSIIHDEPEMQLIVAEAIPQGRLPAIVMLGLCVAMSLVHLRSPCAFHLFRSVLMLCR